MSRVEKFVVIYDIKNNKNRVRLARLLFEYGIRTQLSVFEVEVKEKEYRRFMKLIGRKIKSNGDKIYIYPLDDKSLKRVKRLGDWKNSIISDFFI